MRKLISIPEREQSRNEELANCISRGLAMFGAIWGAIDLIMQAARHGNSVVIFGAAVSLP